MRMLFKIISTIILIPTIYFLFIIGGLPLVEARNVIFPYIDTEFAPNYTPEKFDLITEDFTYEEVVNLIGEPLYDHYDEYLQSKCFDYTDDGKVILGEKSRDYVPIQDFAWYRSTICFNSEGKIIQIDKGWSFD